eukprot:TRINITY_DN2104_c0_g1_i1.p2 TRINITY_DN2104_c0_g1~~TRINITY_DN2104_c0_g1_i1.p2  ORF type:complete len:289 (-),score=71.24 TRINITY_DN2104_c0_g1_i1:1048-1914(-)
MADSSAAIGDKGTRRFGRGGRRGRGDRGAPADGGFAGRRGGPRRGRRGDRKGDESTTWVPVTKLGRLVKDQKIKYLEEIYLHSMSIKEPEVIDYFLSASLKDEVMKISPVQKQTRAGQRTRFKAFVVVGDHDGHIGLGVKCSKEVATAIKGAIASAKLNIVPIRRGYWGNKLGKPHTVPGKINGKCGSIRIRLIPAPRGTGIVAAPVSKKIINYAGIEDIYTSTRGSTRTLGNFAKATYHALSRTYSYLTPDLWPQYELTKAPFQEHSEYLDKNYNAESTTKKGKEDD